MDSPVRANRPRPNGRGEPSRRTVPANQFRSLGSRGGSRSRRGEPGSPLLPLPSCAEAGRETAPERPAERERPTSFAPSVRSEEETSHGLLFSAFSSFLPARRWGTSQPQIASQMPSMAGTSSKSDRSWTLPPMRPCLRLPRTSLEPLQACSARLTSPTLRLRSSPWHPP